MKQCARKTRNRRELVATDDESRARRLARLSAILRAFDPLPVDPLVAASYGQLAAATARAGRKASARSLDLMIAATAMAHGARLVTANPDDVRHLDARGSGADAEADNRALGDHGLGRR